MGDLQDVEDNHVEDLEDGPEGSDEGLLTISGKGKFVLEKADRSLSELHRWYKNGRIIVDPEWQRNYVWNDRMASKLIESFLIDIPVPVIYLAKTKEQKYEVIDGLQRLTSVFRFFDNEMKLSRLEILNDLSGKNFREIDRQSQNKLEDAVLRSFELDSNATDIHFIVFERINTGSVKLNDMEIRNCLFRGPLNDLLKTLSEVDEFRKSVNQPSLVNRMQDRALVLRFLAFYERTHHKCDKGLKRFLNEFLDTYRFASSDKIDEYRKKFIHCMRACLTVFGGSAFRLKSDIAKPGTKSSGEWSTRPNAAIFQVISTSFHRYDLGAITRASDQIYESYVDLINTDAVWVDRVRRATGEATRLKYTFDRWHERLDQVMSNVELVDRKRIFSRQLKEEMFNLNSTCKICGQKIALIDDAAMDHDVRYWDGGKTVPENAQLVHRLCNQKKG